MGETDSQLQRMGPHAIGKLIEKSVPGSTKKGRGDLMVEYRKHLLN